MIYKNKLTQNGIWKNVLFCKQKLAFTLAEVFIPHFDAQRKFAFTPAEVFIPHFDAQRKFAFTLAEVLITLGIIGVVASMTLPALVQNHRNKQLQTGLKKAYSVLGQALDMYQAENGERLTGKNIATQELKPILMKYLKIVKDCGRGSFDDEACIPNYGFGEENNSTTYTTLTGSALYLSNFDDGQFILADGMFVLLENAMVGNLYISVDVNGYNKRPNRFGQDLFMFEIGDKGELRPMGAIGTDYYSENDAYCSPSSTNNMNGAGCTYKALYEEDYFKNLPGG